MSWLERQDDDKPLPPRGFRPNTPRPIDDGRKAQFIAHLARHGIPSAAARAASPHLPAGSDGNYAGFLVARRKDPEFAAAWEMALQIARDNVEAEIHRRGVEGYEEPVFYRGEEVGKVTKYSDSLLLARMKALDPERYGNKVDVKQKIDVQPLGLDQLSADQRDLVRKLLIEEEQTKLIEGAADAEFTEEQTDEPQE